MTEIKDSIRKAFEGCNTSQDILKKHDEILLITSGEYKRRLREHIELTNKNS